MLGIDPKGQSNHTLCFSPQHSMINASSIPLRVLSRDATAAYIDVPPASATTTSFMHSLPIFWENGQGGFALACKIQNVKSAQQQWSRFHPVLDEGTCEPRDVVFRDDDGQIAGCVSIEVLKKDETGDKNSVVVIVRDSSALCR